MTEQVVSVWRCTVCGYIHAGPEPPAECPVCGGPASVFEAHVAVAEPVVKPGVEAWRCTVCGYVHRGSEPPGVCPVCGAGREVFEPYEDAPKPAASPAVAAWRCLNCSHVEPGKQSPGSCPICGASADRFEPAGARPGAARGATEGATVVIVGGGIAGVSAAEALRTAAPDAAIVVLSKEDRLPYYRLNLTRYLAGEVTTEQLPIHPAGWYEDQGISLRLGEAAVSFDLLGKKVRLRSGDLLPYDKLILAAGSHPFIPPIPGASREGVLALRTTDEADRILEACARGGRCVCLGGGLLGLETAGALARRGARVTVIEGFGWLLPRQLDPRSGEILAGHVKEVGIDLRLGVKVRELVGDECVRGVDIEGEGVLDADLVIVATGVRSNSYLARMAGLEVAGGVVVDNQLRCSNPDVFAAGDVAEHRGVVYGTWGPSQYQGSIAGMNAAGAEVEFGGIPRSNTLKVLGVDLFSIGVVTPEDASSTVLSHENEAGHLYRFVFRDNAMVGAILLGSTELTARVKSLVESKQDLSALLQHRPSAADVVEALGG